MMSPFHPHLEVESVKVWEGHFSPSQACSFVDMTLKYCRMYQKKSTSGFPVEDLRLDTVYLFFFFKLFLFHVINW